MATRHSTPLRADRDRRDAIIRWSITLGLLVGWLLLAASMISFDPADPPGRAVVPVNSTPTNWVGPVGAHLSDWTFGLIGSGAWALLAGAGLWIILAIFRRPVSQPGLRLVGLTLLALAISGFLALFWPNSGVRPEGAGGLIAIAGVAELTTRFSTVGAALWLALAAGVGAIVAFDQWLVRIPSAIWTRVAPALGLAASRSRDALARRRAGRRVRLNDLDDDRRLARAARPSTTARVAAANDDEAEEDPEDEYEYVYVDEDGEPIAEDEMDADDEDDLPGAPQVFDAQAARAKIAGLPVRFASVARADTTEDHLRDIQNTAVLENYRFPGLDLLEDPEESYSEEMDRFVRQQAEALEDALRVYHIDGEVVGVDSGPVITLYEVRLAPGTKVSRLSAISSDIARALKAVNIRIVANMAGRDTVGVEVPNLNKEKVRLKELMTCAQDASRVGKMRLPMFLGKDASGEPLIEDLAQMPHMLIAGATGSGKSVCLNTIIMGFLFTKKPNELKLVLIDPKMVELSAFRDVPHLMCPVVTEMAKAAAILEWAVTKMDERYELLAEAGVRDIAGYNNLDEDELLERMAPASEREAAAIPRRLPYLVFVIDELADLIMTHKDVEGAVVRIAQKARAVGIHLVLATQRPQANVVTGLIKSNMPARMSFRVASGMDSRIVLDQKGGELLLGQGDMLFLSPRSHKLMRAQGTLVDDKETRRVVRFLREVAAPTFERQLIQLRAPGEAAPEEHEARGLQSALEDPLFEKAVDIVLETKRGSVSLLQRRLAIGYTRASRLVDLMGEVGVIGAYKGTVARQVVVTPEQWEDMRAQLRAMAEGSDDLFSASPARGPAAPEPEPAHAPPAIEPADADPPIKTHQEEEEEDAAGDEEIPAEDEAAAEDEEDEEYEYVYVDEDGEEWEDDDEDEVTDDADSDASDATDNEQDADHDADRPEVRTAPFKANRPAPQS